MTPLEWKFKGVEGSNRKNHPWKGYGYFLESHINTDDVTKGRKDVDPHGRLQAVLGRMG